MNTDNTTTILKRPKSEKLTKQEVKDLKALRKAFKTETACAAFIGIDRVVLGNTILRGSGHPDYVAKIREGLIKEVPEEAA
jgi:hypothetical protein